MTADVLISGGSGFIGCRLAERLARDRPGSSVVALDNLTRRGSELNLRRLAEAGVAFVHGDIRCPEDLADARLEAQTIIDCSAEPSVLASYRSPQRVIQNNLVGTSNLLECARAWQSAFVFISTSRVFPIAALSRLTLEETESRFALASEQSVSGVSRHGVAESFPLAGHRSLYGATKLAGELLVEEYGEAFGLPWVVNRCGVVAGPGQMARSDQGVFSLWAAAHVLERDLKYIGFAVAGCRSATSYTSTISPSSSPCRSVGWTTSPDGCSMSAAGHPGRCPCGKRRPCARSVKGGTKLDQMAEENQTTWPLGRVSENGCAKGGVRMVERQRRGGRACCVRDDSCRRSAPGCGRDESADRAARQSAVRSRRSRSIR